MYCTLDDLPLGFISLLISSIVSTILWMKILKWLGSSSMAPRSHLMDFPMHAIYCYLTPLILRYIYIHTNLCKESMRLLTSAKLPYASHVSSITTINMAPRSHLMDFPMHAIYCYLTPLILRYIYIHTNLCKESMRLLTSAKLPYASHVSSITTINMEILETTILPSE